MTLAFNSSTTPRSTPLTPITLSNKILFEKHGRLSTRAMAAYRRASNARF
jgi:hypothetical protein